MTSSYCVSMDSSLTNSPLLRRGKWFGLDAQIETVLCELIGQNRYLFGCAFCLTIGKVGHTRFLQVALLFSEGEGLMEIEDFQLREDVQERKDFQVKEDFQLREGVQERKDFQVKEDFQLRVGEGRFPSEQGFPGEGGFSGKRRS